MILIYFSSKAIETVEHLDNLLALQKTLVNEYKIDLDLIQATWLPILEKRGEESDEFIPGPEETIEYEEVDPADVKLLEGEELVKVED